MALKLNFREVTPEDTEILRMIALRNGKAEDYLCCDVTNEDGVTQTTWYSKADVALWGEDYIRAHTTMKYSDYSGWIIILDMEPWNDAQASPRKKKKRDSFPKIPTWLEGFMNYDYDVLLSTTIVENGIDISNANTIIIINAHHFGLSDLHQMRGRVGRSNKKAFCYLVAPPKSGLTLDARRRLEALETFCDLGSGFNLAMQDLDIRGAGNLLGSEQSGFMEDLGYETYQKILSQAVTELKNEEFGDLYQEEMDEGQQLTGDDFVDDCSIESDLEMYFPDTYVPGSSERMLLYRELDRIENDDDLAAYRKRIIDRFGPVPREGEELMHVVSLRRLGKRLGCEKIMLKQGTMQMQFVSNVQSPFYRSTMFSKVLNYATCHVQQCALKEKNNKRFLRIARITSVEQAVGILKEIQK